MTYSDYVSVADTAKLIRSKLAKSFPGTKFYVRSNSYSGGASIDVYYDGLDHYDMTGDGYTGRMTPVYKPGAPTKKDVEAVTSGYAGRGFDGMIDLAYGIDSFLTPDGDVLATASAGTGYSRGLVPPWGPDPPPAGSKKVRFGASYVFVNDTLPYDVRSKAGAA